jgi:hypothetical protein
MQAPTRRFLYFNTEVVGALTQKMGKSSVDYQRANGVKNGSRLKRFTIDLSGSFIAKVRFLLNNE